jgi:hypothetical protein
VDGIYKSLIRIMQPTRTTVADICKCTHAATNKVNIYFYSSEFCTANPSKVQSVGNKWNKNNLSTSRSAGRSFGQLRKFLCN